MSRLTRSICGVSLAIFIIGGPLGYAWYRASQERNFRVVRDGVLLRSGQMSLSGLREAFHDYGIKTVITLRDGPYPGATPPDIAEELYCRAQDIKYCRISPTKWGSEDGSVPAEDGVRRFLEIMRNPENYPVLIHCFAGIHRTGIYIAIYRMEFEHATNAEAIAELKESGYSTLDQDWDVLQYLEEYQPSWRKQTGQPQPTMRIPLAHQQAPHAKHKGKKHAD